MTDTGSALEIAPTKVSDIGTFRITIIKQAQNIAISNQTVSTIGSNTLNLETDLDFVIA
jgi:hypothetical protein